VAQDYAEAVKWYRLAAEQGHANAQSNLGLMYNNGRSVAQDYIQAHMWSNLAAANGSEAGRKNRDIIAKKMTAADISKAQVLAREWLEGE
jgi:TPR repeat protein